MTETAYTSFSLFTKIHIGIYHSTLKRREKEKTFIYIKKKKKEKKGRKTSSIRVHREPNHCAIETPKVTWVTRAQTDMILHLKSGSPYSGRRIVQTHYLSGNMLKKREPKRQHRWGVGGGRWGACFFKTPAWRGVYLSVTVIKHHVSGAFIWGRIWSNV